MRTIAVGRGNGYEDVLIGTRQGMIMALSGGRHVRREKTIFC